MLLSRSVIRCSKSWTVCVVDHHYTTAIEPPPTSAPADHFESNRFRPLGFSIETGLNTLGGVRHLAFKPNQ